MTERSILMRDAYELLVEIVEALERIDARDSEWLHCVICEGGGDLGPHAPDCAYVRAAALIGEREGSDD